MKSSSSLINLRTSSLTSIFPFSPPLIPARPSRKRRRVIFSLESNTISLISYNLNLSFSLSFDNEFNLFFSFFFFSSLFSIAAESLLNSTSIKLKRLAAKKRKIRRQSEKKKIERILETLKALE